MDRRDVNALALEAQQELDERGFVRHLQDDRVRAFAQIARAGFARGVDKHRAKNTKGEVASHDHVVRDRVSGTCNRPGVNVSCACRSV